jgi:hypothetical protein
MRHITGAFVLAVVVTAAASTSAFANSCTDQGQECKAWATGQGATAPTYVAKCAAEVNACKARCNAGNKVFIGVSVGNAYPVTNCK